MTAKVVATASNAVKGASPSADMRLVPAAVGTWAVTLVCLYTGWQVASGMAWAGCVVTVALAFARGRWVNGAAVLVVLGAATAFCLVPRLHHVENHELRAAELSGESVGVRVELTRRPRPTDADPANGRGAGERSVVRAELRAIRNGGEWHRTGGRALLLVPTSSWADSLPGRTVRTTAVVVPPHGRGCSQPCSWCTSPRRSCGRPRTSSEWPKGSEPGCGRSARESSVPRRPVCSPGS